MDPTSQLLPAAFASWHPLAQASALFLSTFILEDAAALGAGLLLGTDGIGWSVAFWSCFAGIWLGDAGLYAIARWWGRPWFEGSRLRRHAAQVKRSEEWFARRGPWLLVITRMIPGSRLPTYLAAGFLRVPVARFVIITGIAAFVWTALILALSRQFGEWLQTYLQFGTRSILILYGLLLAIMIGLGVRRQLGKGVMLRRLRAVIGRWVRWEFWPPWLFYAPVAAYCVWLAIKHRGLSLPAAANPGIFAGGLVGESKMEILEPLMRSSPGFTAPAALIREGAPEDRVRRLREVCVALRMEPPFILKPDQGQRGAGVKFVRSWEQAAAYLASTDAPMLVQRHAPGPFEVGVFYYRFPSEARGHIFAITEKVFPEIVGDGTSTVAELIERDDRARLLSHVYLRRFAGRRDEVLAPGERLRLVEAGNHAQGCIFLDGRRLQTGELEAVIDEIAQRLDRFFVGRFDIRYADKAAFLAGKEFQIVELNGASAEATNIYDPRNSLWSAYRTLFRQWGLVFAIGAANRSAGAAGTGWWPVLRAWWHYRRLASAYALAD
ncbi:MAG TPA: hypothetical protein DCY13_04765 [Verrucomicrobiales bacterium]|nr:hypothetical protein [Verrucomicrobiales bacterium]